MKHFFVIMMKWYAIVHLYMLQFSEKLLLFSLCLFVHIFVRKNSRLKMLRRISVLSKSKDHSIKGILLLETIFKCLHILIRWFHAFISWMLNFPFCLFVCMGFFFFSIFNIVIMFVVYLFFDNYNTSFHLCIRISNKNNPSTFYTNKKYRNLQHTHLTHKQLWNCTGPLPHLFIKMGSIVLFIFGLPRKKDTICVRMKKSLMQTKWLSLSAVIESNGYNTHKTTNNTLKFCIS